MKSVYRACALLFTGLVSFSVFASTRYVNVDSLNPQPPYLSWATAANCIQDAVDLAADGDVVFVTNGIYQAGGQIVFGAMSNRVAITRAVTVQSVNGPDFTIIRGFQTPGTTNGNSSVRCAYLTNNAALIGFTLQNGSTRAAGDQTHEASGGGAWCWDTAVVSNCVITGNSALLFGGGIRGGRVSNCIISNNVAQSGGGVASASLVESCVINGNLATDTGGGAFFSLIGNCTIVGNTARFGGGGAYQGKLWNSIIYYNTNTVIGTANHESAALTNCCTTPTNFLTIASITNAPLFVDLPGLNFRLQSGSPGINGGANAYVTGDRDLAGNPRIQGNVVDLGAYEIAPITHYVNLLNFTPLPPYTNWATAAVSIQDAIDIATPGDVIFVTNGVYASGGRVVGSLTNRVADTKGVTLQSVNGPLVTVIEGFQVPGMTNGNNAIRAVYLANGSLLNGFTVTNGATRTSGSASTDQNGGGVWCESVNVVVTNCIILRNAANAGGGGIHSGTVRNSAITDNLASGTSGTGGGASQSTLNGCLIARNTAKSSAGGASAARLSNCLVLSNSTPGFAGGAIGYLTNCTVIGNIAGTQGGGIYEAQARNCIVLHNTATTSGANHIFSTISYSCTTPLPGGAGNFTFDPAFADLAGGNFRLQSSSPCINAGNNTFGIGISDLDGNSRVAGGTVDVGAYEFQSPASLISYAWLQEHGFPLDGSADFIDADNDLMNNWQEWRAGTLPMNNLSVLQFSAISNHISGATIRWQSVTNRTYLIQRATNLSSAPAFSLVKSNLAGVTGTMSYTDTNAPVGRAFYRVGIQD